MSDGDTHSDYEGPGGENRSVADVVNEPLYTPEIQNALPESDMSGSDQEESFFGGGKRRKVSASKSKKRRMTRSGRKVGRGMVGGVSDLKDYQKSIYSKNKELIIRKLAKNIGPCLGIPGLENKSIDEIHKAIKSKLPSDPSKDYIVDKKHKALTDCMMNAINEIYGWQVVRPKDKPEDRAQLSVDIIRSLFTGLNSEFLVISEDVRERIDALETLLGILEQSQRKTAAALTKLPLNVRMESENVSTIMDSTIHELRTQLSFLKNMLNVAIEPASKDILKNTERQRVLDGYLRKFQESTFGTKKYGQKLLAVLNSAESLMHLTTVVQRALKDVGMSVDEYKKVKGLNDLQERLFKLMQKTSKSHPTWNELNKFLEAAELLKREEFRRDKILKVMGGTELGNTYENMLGGDPDNYEMGQEYFNGGDPDDDDVQNDQNDQNDQMDQEENQEYHSQNDDQVETFGGARTKSRRGKSSRSKSSRSKSSRGKSGKRGRGEYSDDDLLNPENTDRVDTRIAIQKRNRNLVAKTFTFKLNTLYKQMFSYIDSMVADVGTKIYLDDKLDHFEQKLFELEGLFNAKNDELILSLLGDRNDSAARSKKLQFIGALEDVKLSAAKLNGTKDLVECISNIIAMINDVSDVFADTRTVNLVDESSGIKGGAVCSLNSIGLGGCLKEITQSSVNISNVISKFRYMKRSLAVRANIAVTNYSSFNEKYEEVLGQAVGNKINLIKKEMKDLLETVKKGINNESAPGSPGVTAENPKYRYPHHTDVVVDLGAQPHFYCVSKKEEKYAEKTVDSVTKFYKTVTDVRVKLYRTLEALDLYLSAFADGIAKNPEDVGDIMKLVESVQLNAQWYTDKVGTQYAALFDLFPQHFQAKKSHITDYNKALISAAGNNHYWKAINDTVDTGFGTKASATVCLGTHPAQYFVEPTWGIEILKDFNRVLCNITVLKNIVSLFLQVGKKFGNQSVIAKCPMTPAQIHKNLVEYLVVSSFTDAIYVCDANANANTVNTPEAILSKHQNGFIVASDAATPVYGITLRFNNLMHGPAAGPTSGVTPKIGPKFDGDDHFFTDALRAMVGKVLTAAGVCEMLFAPSTKISKVLPTNPIRRILGGDELTIFEDAIELYIRVPLMLEFYRGLHELRSGSGHNMWSKAGSEDRIITMLPDFDNTWSTLIDVVYNRAVGIKSGGYNTAQIQTMISEINKIYKAYKDKTDVVRQVMLALVNEMNMRYGLYCKDEIEKYLEQHRVSKYDDEKFDKEELTNFDILEDEDAEYDYHRSNPSDKYVRADLNAVKVDERDRLAPAIRNAVKAFHDRVERALDLGEQTKLANYSFRDTIDQAKFDFKKAGSAEEKFGVVLRAVQLSNNISASGVDKMVFLRETVLNTLESMEFILKDSIKPEVERINNNDSHALIASLMYDIDGIAGHGELMRHYGGGRSRGKHGGGLMNNGVLPPEVGNRFATGSNINGLRGLFNFIANDDLNDFNNLGYDLSGGVAFNYWETLNYNLYSTIGMILSGIPMKGSTSSFAFNTPLVLKLIDLSGAAKDFPDTKENQQLYEYIQEIFKNGTKYSEPTNEINKREMLEVIYLLTKGLIFQSVKNTKDFQGKEFKTNPTWLKNNATPISQDELNDFDIDNTGLLYGSSGIQNTDYQSKLRALNILKTINDVSINGNTVKVLSKSLDFTTSDSAEKSFKTLSGDEKIKVVRRLLILGSAFSTERITGTAGKPALKNRVVGNTGLFDLKAGGHVGANANVDVDNYYSDAQISVIFTKNPHYEFTQAYQKIMYMYFSEIYKNIYDNHKKIEEQTQKIEKAKIELENLFRDIVDLDSQSIINIAKLKENPNIITKAKTQISILDNAFKFYENLRPTFLYGHNGSEPFDDNFISNQDVQAYGICHPDNLKGASMFKKGVNVASQALFQKNEYENIGSVAPKPNVGSMVSVGNESQLKELGSKMVEDIETLYKNANKTIETLEKYFDEAEDKDISSNDVVKPTGTKTNAVKTEIKTEIANFFMPIYNDNKSLAETTCKKLNQYFFHKDNEFYQYDSNIIDEIANRDANANKKVIKLPWVNFLVEGLFNAQFSKNFVDTAYKPIGDNDYVKASISIDISNLLKKPDIFVNVKYYVNDANKYSYSIIGALNNIGLDGAGKSLASVAKGLDSKAKITTILSKYSGAAKITANSIGSLLLTFDITEAKHIEMYSNMNYYLNYIKPDLLTPGTIYPLINNYINTPFYDNQKVNNQIPGKVWFMLQNLFSLLPPTADKSSTARIIKVLFGGDLVNKDYSKANPLDADDNTSTPGADLINYVWGSNLGGVTQNTFQRFNLLLTDKMLSYNAGDGLKTIDDSLALRLHNSIYFSGPTFNNQRGPIYGVNSYSDSYPMSYEKALQIVTAKTVNENENHPRLWQDKIAFNFHDYISKMVDEFILFKPYQISIGASTLKTYDYSKNNNFHDIFDMITSTPLNNHQPGSFYISNLLVLSNILTLIALLPAYYREVNKNIKTFLENDAEKVYSFYIPTLHNSTESYNTKYEPSVINTNPDNVNGYTILFDKVTLNKVIFSNSNIKDLMFRGENAPTNESDQVTDFSIGSIYNIGNNNPIGGYDLSGLNFKNSDDLTVFKKLDALMSEDSALLYEHKITIPAFNQDLAINYHDKKIINKLTKNSSMDTSFKLITEKFPNFLNSDMLRIVSGEPFVNKLNKFNADLFNYLAVQDEDVDRLNDVLNITNIVTVSGAATNFKFLIADNNLMNNNTINEIKFILKQDNGTPYDFASLGNNFKTIIKGLKNHFNITNKNRLVDEFKKLKGQSNLSPSGFQKLNDLVNINNTSGQTSLKSLLNDNIIDSYTKLLNTVTKIDTDLLNLLTENFNKDYYTDNVGVLDEDLQDPNYLEFSKRLLEFMVLRSEIIAGQALNIDNLPLAVLDNHDNLGTLKKVFIKPETLNFTSATSIIPLREELKFTQLGLERNQKSVKPNSVKFTPPVANKDQTEPRFVWDTSSKDEYKRKWIGDNNGGPSYNTFNTSKPLGIPTITGKDDIPFYEALTVCRGYDFKNLDKLHPLLDFIEPVLRLQSNKMVDYSIDEGNFVLDFTKLINNLETSLKNSKNMFQLLRSHVTDKKFIETIEKKVQDVEELMDRIIRGRYTFENSGQPSMSIMDLTEYKSAEFRALTSLSKKRTPLDVDFAISLQSLVETDDTDLNVPFFSNVVTLMHTDKISPPSTGLLSARGKSSLPVADSLTKYPKSLLHSKILKRSLMTKNVHAGSLMQSFNNLLAHYVESVFDIGSGVVYNKTLEPFINDAYPAVMNGMGFLDSSPFLVAHAELLNYTKREPVSASLGYTIRRMFTEKVEKGESLKWVRTEVTALPEFYKEKLRRDLVLFINLFKVFLERAETLREIASLTSMKVLLRSCPLQEVLQLDDAKLNDPEKPVEFSTTSNDIIRELKEPGSKNNKTTLLARLSAFENNEELPAKLTRKELINNDKLGFKYCLNTVKTADRDKFTNIFKNGTTLKDNTTAVFMFQSLNKIIAEYKLPLPKFEKDSGAFEDLLLGSIKDVLPINYINPYKGSESDELTLRSTEEYRNYYLAVVDKFVKYTNALMKGAEMTLRDLESANTIGDVSKNFLTEYKSRNRVPAIIAPSYFNKLSMTRFVSDRVAFDELDGPGSNEFKLSYAFRNLVDEDVKKEKSSFEYLLSRLNATMQQQVNPGLFNNLLEQELDLMSYMYNLVNDKNAFSFTDVDFSVSSNYDVDANQIVYQIESSNQKSVMRQLAAEMSNVKVITDRNMAVKVNILDLNIAPVNYKALTRSVAMANLYNYSFTCDAVMRSEGKHFEHLLNILDGGVENGTPVNQILSQGDTLLINFLLSHENGYGRPKFLVDQIFHKASFGQIDHISNNYRREIGQLRPLTTDTFNPATSYLDKNNVLTPANWGNIAALAQDPTAGVTNTMALTAPGAGSNRNAVVLAGYLRLNTKLSMNMTRIIIYHMFLRNYLLRGIERTTAPVLKNLRALAPDIAELRQNDDINRQVQRFNEND